MRFIFIISLISSSVFATDMDTRIKAKYNELHQKAKTYCDYIGDPVATSIDHLDYKVIAGKAIETYLLIKGTEALIKILPQDKKGLAILELENHLINGEIKKSNKIEFDLSKLSSEFIKQYNLTKLNCAVDIAVADTYVLSKPEIHINVHPHANYDYLGKTIPSVQEFIAKFSENSLALLDDHHRKAEGYNLVSYINNGGDHFSVKYFPNPSFEIPSSVDMIVSPAGHNRFKLEQEETTIHYTGGNHNYCMFNNARRVMDGFFQNSEAKILNFIYYPKAIVVQRKGVIGGDTNIPLWIYKVKKLYVLSEIFEAMSEQELSTYKNSFKNFYINDLAKFRSQYFKTLTINYDGSSTVLNGSGNRDLQVNFSYQ